MTTRTHDEWMAAGTQRFGEQMRHWKFVCPSCKDVASGQDFIDEGVEPERAQNRIGQECIGRSLGALDKSIPKGEYKGRGCDWCAYGLFGGPDFVTFPDGKKIGIFPFAVPE